MASKTFLSDLRWRGVTSCSHKNVEVTVDPHVVGRGHIEPSIESKCQDCGRSLHYYEVKGEWYEENKDKFESMEVVDVPEYARHDVPFARFTLVASSPYLRGDTYPTPLIKSVHVSRSEETNVDGIPFMHVEFRNEQGVITDTRFIMSTNYRVCPTCGTGLVPIRTVKSREDRKSSRLDCAIEEMGGE